MQRTEMNASEKKYLLSYCMTVEHLLAREINDVLVNT